MTRLYLDFETRSIADLADVGHENYMAHPSTQAICMAYAFSATNVCLWKRSEPFPQEVIGHVLSGGEVVAHNIAFDAAVFKLTFGVEIPLSQQICTQAKAAMNNVPQSLDHATKFLGLSEQKMPISKVTAGKLRRPASIYPLAWYEKPEALAGLYEYCKQDVEACRALDEALPDLPASERVVWELDQEVNRRGMALDVGFIHNCSRVAAEYKQALDEKLRTLTGGVVLACSEVKKLLAWINGFGMNLESIDKNALTMARALPNLPRHVAEALEMRANYAKTSTAKLQAALDELGPDGRLRNQLRYHGAATGRWCLTGDHEVLTEGGWVRFDSWEGGRIATWAPNDVVSFQPSKVVSFDYTGEMKSIETNRISQTSTPDHKMPGYSIKSGDFYVWVPGSFKRVHVPFTGTKAFSAEGSNWLRVMVMVQADGHFCDDGSIRLQFKKARKTERCKRLLRTEGIEHTITANSDGITAFYIPARKVPAYLKLFATKTFGWWLLNVNPDVLFDEIERWDGYRCGPNSVQYATTNKTNADIVSTLAHLSGRAASIVVKSRPETGWADCYYVNIWLTPANRHELRSVETGVFSGKVFCAETPTGFFLVRRNGKIWVTGNSGRGAQPQNFPRLDEELSPKYFQALQNGEAIENPLEAISKVLRYVIVAPEGRVLAGGDFSAIEARVLAWLAGQDDLLGVFRNGQDVYLHAASRIYKRPITAADKDERTIGKVSTLALGYQGGTGAFDNMARLYGVNLPEAEQKRIIALWRDSNQAIVKYWGDLENAAISACKTRGVNFSAGAVGRCITFRCDGNVLKCRLPSKRVIYFQKAAVRRAFKFGVMKDEVTYWGKQTGRKDWHEVHMYGGKGAENITQAVARDCLVEAMLRLRDTPYKIVSTVHDEVLCEVSAENVDIPGLKRLLTEPPKWALDLPMGASVWTDRRYSKA